MTTMTKTDILYSLLEIQKLLSEIDPMRCNTMERVRWGHISAKMKVLIQKI